MGFFFRRSTKLGPFRLNFSKSGIGTSLGIKGARFTMTPRGTTYVTVGSHGFYYRETFSSPNHTHRQPYQTPEEPHVVLPKEPIASAESTDVVDSSAERLITQLNERAKIPDWSWVFFLLAALCFVALFVLGPPKVPRFPDLPDVTSPVSDGRNANTVDEYSALTARFGEPNSIRFAQVSARVPIPVGTAEFSAAHVKVVFVPNGCVTAYAHGLQSAADKSRPARLVEREKHVPQCLPLPNSGWTTVDYIDSVDNNTLPAGVATDRLDSIPLRKMPPPLVEFFNGQSTKPGFIPPSAGKKQAQPHQEMNSNDKSRLEAEEMRRKITSAIVWMVFSRASCILLAIGSCIAGMIASNRVKAKRRSHLFYELDKAEQRKHDIVKQAFGLLSGCHRIWMIERESATSEWKRNAGASALVERKAIEVGTFSPPFVETNVSVPCLNLARCQLYFLPDTILYHDSKGFQAIAYSDFQVTQGVTRFIESETVASDAVVVDHTWRYVNKAGGPDRRFSNNQQIPVLQLGVLTFVASSGLNLRLNTSNPHQSLAFANCWRTRLEPGERTAHQRTNSKPPDSNRDASSSPINFARKMLGVDQDASAVDISAAYRRLAVMYHPDKVAGLAPEFQTLADKRMKEINAAYEVLKATQ